MLTRTSGTRTSGGNDDDRARARRDIRGQGAGRRASRRAGLAGDQLAGGRVSNPALPAGEVRVGGFGGAEGLAAYATAEGVGAVVDATHPFAETISAHAVDACARAGLPLLRLARPGWTRRDGDDWHDAGSLGEAAAMLPGLGTRVFLTTGRQGLAAFAALDLWFLIRCVDPPDGPQPARSEVLLARGPYEREAERALMQRFGIDVLVTKNSGGPLTEGKLDAARDLRHPGGHGQPPGSRRNRVRDRRQ